MKKYLSLFLSIALLLSICVLPAQAEGDVFRFTRENFPRMDGSTSMVPLGQGIASALLGESREDAADLILFNRTTQSFRNLREGLCDVVIAAEPKQEVFTEMQEAAFPYLMETIAKEALVFVVNASNPVDSLTGEQIRGIYSGAITNWKEVGGEDLPIEAFQRNPTAGSQVMMEKLVMDGTPMVEAPATMVPMEMGGLIDAVRSYDNTANALGYTVFYYATDMQMAQGLKILKVDGVLPQAETIQSGEYPYINGYYCCISAWEALDSPARRLFDWLVSDAGQSLLNLEGYVPVSAAGEAPSSGADVHTDFTHYAPNGSTVAQFTVFDCPMDHLEPRDDYGLIYPYDGAGIYGSWGDESWDYHAGSEKGFYTHEGQLITRPVYSEITRSALGEWAGGDYFWILSKDGIRYSFAAKDGSFVSEPKYAGIYPIDRQIVAVLDFELGEFEVYDSQFRLVKTQEDFRTESGILIPSTSVNGFFCGNLVTGTEDMRMALIDSDCRTIAETSGYIHLSENGTAMVYDEDWHVTLLNTSMEAITLENYTGSEMISQLNGQFYYIWSPDSAEYIIDRNGSTFEWGFDSYRTYEDCFSVLRGDTQTVYDTNGRILYRELPSDWDYLGQLSVFSERKDGSLVIHKLPEDKTLTIPGGSYAYSSGSIYLVEVEIDDVFKTRLVTKDLVLCDEIFEFLGVVTDPYTGEELLEAYGSYGFAGETRLLAADGKTELFRINGRVTPEDGFITVTDDWAFTCYDRSGNVIFCYPYYGMGTGD